MCPSLAYPYLCLKVSNWEIYERVLIAFSVDLNITALVLPIKFLSKHFV